jgi:LacI family transcriptional regulator
VESDSFGGALTATRHLIELGHRRIGFLGGRPDLRSAGLRDAGYRRALCDAGIPVDPSLIRLGRYELETTREAARVLLAGPARPTAVFAANDLSAIAVIDVAHDLGLRVPEDLSVIGFDDVPEASRRALPLTTIRQPMQRLGAVAADMVFTLLGGGEVEQTHVTLPTRLVVRATTARLRD